MNRHNAVADGTGSQSTSLDERRSALVCPVCHGVLAWWQSESRCTSCPRRYEVVDEIPILLAWEMSDDTVSTDGPCSASQSRLGHKRRQARFFDEEDAELEICRPHGQPAFYGWLLREKYRRSIAALGPLQGLSAVTVCGGSGMDAEFLARSGASVISIDISLGAARRTLERARRFGVRIMAVVADAEHLPLENGVVDLAYVHDGLHHLTDPHVGIREMTRVARQAISITEPAQATATTLAIRLRIALAEEEAGNRVQRLHPAEIERTLAQHGFRAVHRERYAMYYQQMPGAPMRLASRRHILPWATRLLTTGNRVAGRLGNKLTVQARATGADLDAWRSEPTPGRSPLKLKRCG